MAFIVLNRIVKDKTVATNFNLDGLNFLPKSTAEPGVRNVVSEHPYGTHRVRIDPGDSLTVRETPDPDAASLV